MIDSPDTKPGPEPTTPTVAKQPRLIVGFFIVVLLLLIGDLALKWWAFESFAGPVDIPAVLADEDPLPAKDMTVVPNVLAIKLVLNRGAVFGLGQGYTWVFLLITVFAVGFVGYVLLTSPADHRLMHLCLALILAGALGNMVDRITFSAVRDMLHLFPGVQLPFGLQWGNGSTEVYPWIFNLADVFLTVGIALMLIRSVIPHRRPEPTPTEPRD
jgi:signal peptidase II